MGGGLERRDRPKPDFARYDRILHAVHQSDHSTISEFLHLAPAAILDDGATKEPTFLETLPRRAGASMARRPLNRPFVSTCDDKFGTKW